jgi:hypothetical protein
MVPLFAYALIIAIIDPFNYLNSWGIGDRDNKDDIAEQVEPHLFRMIKFHNAPTKNISLGDSRSNGLFARIESQEWSNLGYGGSSLQEMIETFWWVAGVVKPDTVIMGINLNLYNKYNKKFWVQETIGRSETFFSYAFNRYTFQSTYLILQSYISGEKVRMDKPRASKEEFWKYTLDVMGSKFYEQFGYPDEYYEGLKNISEYCASNRITLIFWIPPTHVDFQNRKADFELEQMDQKFVGDLRSLGDLYDFDYPSDLTSNKDDYRDPMHFDIRVGEIVHSEIFLRSPHYARFSAVNYSVNTGDKNSK